MTAATLLLAPLANAEDVFEEDAPFVPIEVQGATRLVARASIVTIVVDDDDEDAAPASLAIGVLHPLRGIRVHLRGGATMTGVIALSSTSRRTLDVLNEPKSCFTMRDNGRVMHVAKAHVTRVEEVA